ncbi:penicillin-binding protein 2 [bacterium]|nr:penicillin-binding protein 2 [bacterium]
MPNPYFRIKALGVFLGLALLGIATRLWWIQLTHWSDYAVQAEMNRTTVVTKQAPRGLICDRRGRVLAENRDVWNLCMIPSQLPEDQVSLEREVTFLASTLSTPEDPVSTAEVRKALQRGAKATAVEPVPLGNLGQDLSFDQVARIEERQMDLPGISVVTTTRRHYPYGALAAQTIGYARAISRDQLEKVKAYIYPLDRQDPTASDLSGTNPDLIYDPSSIIGIEGAEAMCELDTTGKAPRPLLPGRRGRTVYEVDSVGASQRLIAEREPVPGALVNLTLDAEVQWVAERALRDAFHGRSDAMGAVVVMDTRNGDVLALASEPCLDPNDWVSGITPELWQAAQKTPGLPLLNKATAGAYPPGSVFKVVSICSALETTNVTPASSAYCTGTIHVGRRHEPFRCWTSDRGGHGAVDLLEAIAKSCNIFFYQCVLQHNLDPDAIADYARRFGLGESTGLGLKGEVAGQVPSPKFSINETGQPWRQGNSLNFVIGQDRLTVTPVQMCVIAAALANGGKLVTPNLVSRVRWPQYMHRQDTVNLLGRSRQLQVKPETIGIVRQGMRLAVEDEHGTAKVLRELPITSAGKTGSAQHVRDEPTHAWFIGFAPYEAGPGERQYAVCVFVGGGGTGGETAVPVADQVFRALLGLHAPDDEAFIMPGPMDPATVAARRRARLAEAEALYGSGRSN